MTTAETSCEANSDSPRESEINVPRLLETVSAQAEIISLLADRTRQLAEQIARLDKSLRQVARDTETTRYATSAPVLDDIWYYLEERQLSLLGTLEALRDTDASLGRFRESELRMMSRPMFQPRQQRNSESFSRKLREVFASSDSGYLVGLPQYSRDPYWAGVWTEVWPAVRGAARPLETFVNSHVTRPLVFQFLGSAATRLWSEVFADEDICMFTSGPDGRHPLIPQLFGDARRIDVVRLDGKDVFEDGVDRVQNRVDQTDHTLFLLSTGPSAPILTKMLHDKGRRALDIGNLIASYRSVYEGGPNP